MHYLLREILHYLLEIVSYIWKQCQRKYAKGKKQGWPNKLVFHALKIAHSRDSHAIHSGVFTILGGKTK